MQLSKHTFTVWLANQRKKTELCTHMRNNTLFFFFYYTKHKHLLCRSITVNTEDIKKVYCIKNTKYKAVQFTGIYSFWIEHLMSKPKGWIPNQQLLNKSWWNFSVGITVICNTVGNAVISFINSHVYLLQCRRHARSSSYVQLINSLNTVGINWFRQQLHTQHLPHSKKSLIKWHLLVWQTDSQLCLCLSSLVEQCKRKREVGFHWLRICISTHSSAAITFRFSAYFKVLSSAQYFLCTLCDLQCFLYWQSQH